MKKECLGELGVVKRSLQKRGKNMKKQLITNKNKAKKEKMQLGVAKKRV